MFLIITVVLANLSYLRYFCLKIALNRACYIPNTEQYIQAILEEAYELVKQSKLLGKDNH